MPDPTPEELAAQVAVVEPKVEVPVVELEKKVADPEPDPVEVAARTKGWKPKEEYTGDPGMWVDAKEFVGREPLFDKIRSQSRELKEVKKTVDAMASHFKKSVDFAVNAKIVELKTQRTEAIKEGDVEKVDEIDTAIEAQKAAKADVPTTPEIAPEIKTWVETNPWYTKDAELHDFALAYNESYLKRNPGDLEGSLRETAKATKRAFPDKFPKDGGNGEAAGKRPAPTVEGSSAPAGKGKSISVSRLNADQRLAHDQYVKAGIFTSEEYIKELDKMGELTK